MDGCDGDMRSVGGSFARDFTGGQNSGRQFRHLGRDVQQWQILDDLEPLACCDGVSRAGFVNDKLRDVARCKGGKCPFAFSTIPL